MNSPLPVLDRFFILHSSIPPFFNSPVDELGNHEWWNWGIMNGETR